MIKKKVVKTVFANVTMGLQLGMTVAAFVYGGNLLDEHFNKSPLFLLIGAVLGMIIGFYQLLKAIPSAKKKASDDEKKSENNKWL